MTRDLPFDDDSEAAENVGDTAYRVANGVARVARAGAYVTGGALVASNGGGVPAHPGDSRLDSWSTGWAHSTDPDSDQPSPVMTFPDPVETGPVNSPRVSDSHVAYREGTSASPLPGTDAHAGLALPTLGGDYSGTDAGLPLPTLAGDDGGYGMALPGSSGGGVPGLGGIPGTGGASPALTLPGSESAVAGELPSLGAANSHAATRPFGELDHPEGQGFGLPGHGLGQAGHGFGLPGANGFVAPGSTVFDLPGNNGLGAAEHSADPFDGVGAGGDHLGVFVGTEWSVDFEVGPHGIYFESEMKVDVAVGHVGDQIDEYTDWLGDGMHLPSGNRASGDGHTSGHSLSVPGGGTPASSTSSGYGAASGAGQPSAASAPISAAPVMPAAASPAVGTAPVGTAPIGSGPAPVAPAAPVAPQAAAAPVVAVTPLQTTIQPDAASTPIANVLAAPDGPSMLTAPAAVVPALFDHVRPTPPPVGKPVPVTDSHPSDPVQPPQAPTTIVKTTPTPSVPDVTVPATPSLPKTPDHGVTPAPGVSTPAHGGVVTTPDLPATKTAPPVTHAPVPSTVPDDDVTSPGGVSVPNTGTPHTTQPSAPVDNTPGSTPGGTGNTAPIDDVPTVSVPAQPTAVPTHSAPTHAPTVDPITPVVPTHVAPAPTQAQVPIKPQGISAPLAADHAVDPGFASVPVADHPVDHSALMGASGFGLSGALLPDSAVLDTHHLAADGLDFSLM